MKKNYYSATATAAKITKVPVEVMTPRFFERIDVFRGYQMKYHIVSEVKQFLPVTMLCENHYDFLPVSNGTTLSTQKPYQ